MLTARPRALSRVSLSAPRARSSCTASRFPLYAAHDSGDPPAWEAATRRAPRQYAAAERGAARAREVRRGALAIRWRQTRGIPRRARRSLASGRRFAPSPCSPGWRPWRERLSGAGCAGRSRAPRLASAALIPGRSPSFAASSSASSLEDPQQAPNMDGHGRGLVVEKTTKAWPAKKCLRGPKRAARATAAARSREALNVARAGGQLQIFKKNHFHQAANSSPEISQIPRIISKFGKIPERFPVLHESITCEELAGCMS